MLKVYLVGAGPGDFKLITLRGLELIRKADIIIYDHLINKDLLSYSKNNAELIYVGKQASKHELPQHDINRLIVEKAKKGGIVVRLKGGDPFIFGRGGEEAEFLFDNGVDFEIVPGVTSAIAAPAYAGIPLTHRDYASTVAFITGHEDHKKRKSAIKWDEIAKGPDTLVFLMGIKNLKEIKNNLIKYGRNKNTPACIVHQGTMPTQKVVTGTLDEIDMLAETEDIKAPGIIVVGDVVHLRKKLAWFENKPLSGKKIAVTRAPHQSIKMGELFAEKGANVIYLPTIEVIPLEPNNLLLESINFIQKYFCIIFTSVNGVSIFLNKLFAEGKDIRALHGIKIIPIGEATFSALKSNGLNPDFLPNSFTSEGIVDVLKCLEIKNKKFLHPQAAEARNIIAEYIRRHGGECDVIPVYKTSIPSMPVPITEMPDVITFTSSSTVNNFIKIYGKDILHNSLVASIGPITSETLKSHNINVHMMAKRYDLIGLVEAIEDYMKK